MLRDWLTVKRARGLAAAGLISYVIVALWPFAWAPPRFLRNEAVVTGDRRLLFEGPGVARIRPRSFFLDRAIESQSLQIRLRVYSLRSQQFGPARIFSISNGRYLRNLTVAQDGSDLVIRLRTPETSDNGKPPYVVAGVFENPAWQELTISIEPGRFTLLRDDQVVLTERLPDRPLANWNRQMATVLGNETTGDRPWLGHIASATVVIEQEEYDLLAPDACDLPEGFWQDLRYQSLRHLPDLLRQRDFQTDALLNFLAFIPLGVILAASTDRKRLCRAVLICALASLLVETSQFFAASRVPSPVDWLANVSGAIVGVWAGHRLLGACTKTATPRS